MTTQDMWQAYSRERTPELRRDLVMSYLNLVRFVVSRLSVPQAAESALVEEDLVQFGVLGLLESIDRYDPGRGIKFETFAVPRIRGAIQDELRRIDWVPRSVRKRSRMIDRAIQHAEAGPDTDERAAEIAAKLSLTVDEYRALLREPARAVQEMTHPGDEGIESLENYPSDEADPLAVIEEDDTRARLLALVEQLPERDRLVISLYYYENLTFKEIAIILKISDSRVFQIHSAVLDQLRRKLNALNGQ